MTQAYTSQVMDIVILAVQLAITFLKQFVSTKISQWSSELETVTLSSFAVTQPHAAYAAFTHGLSSKWTYLLRTSHLDEQLSTELLLPLETTICSKFLPSFSGISPPNELMRALLALPCRLGGLNVVNPIESCAEQFTSSQLISRPLVDLIVKQSNQLFECDAVQQRIKSTLKQTRFANLQALARRLYSSFSAPLQRCLDLAQEKGASNWLTALPI